MPAYAVKSGYIHVLAPMLDIEIAKLKSPIQFWTHCIYFHAAVESIETFNFVAGLAASGNSNSDVFLVGGFESVGAGRQRCYKIELFEKFDCRRIGDYANSAAWAFSYSALVTSCLGENPGKPPSWAQ